MSKTREEIEALKASWKNDPIWDLEDTEGFEEYRDELVAFQKEQEAKWKAQSEEELRETFAYRIRQIRSTLRANEQTIVSLQDHGIMSGSELMSAILMHEQVQALVLLAEQVKRVVDILAEKNEEDLASDQTDFMTRLYSIK